MTERIESVVIGAGVIGLAIARALAQAGREVIVLEAADAIGTGISSRNSEVIHAGLYYPTGSLKAELCVAGRRMLYEFCESHGVEHRRTGKLVVATDAAQEEALAAIHAQADANDVEDVEWLDGKQAQALEPDLKAHAALLSNTTGIVDSHGLMMAMQGDAEDAGAMVAFNAPFESAELGDGGGHLIQVGGDAPMTLQSDMIINSAGLGAQAVAAQMSGLSADHVPGLYLAKGNYFTLSGRAPFSRLIYPVPEVGGLGIHLTLDLQGQARFGPDVEWVDAETYDVPEDRRAIFEAAVRTYWPALPEGSLMPGYAGIRPKIQPKDAGAADFMIQGPADHGVQGLVNLFGMESPGLTASLAIAARVVKLLS